MVVHPHEPRRRLRGGARPRLRPEPGARRLPHDATAARPGSRCSFKDADTGASDVALDPRNPRILFAGLWQARRRPWELTSGGPGQRPLPLARRRRHLEAADRATGLPGGDLGQGRRRASRRRTRSASTRSIEAEKGGLFRSDDGGESWTLVERPPRAAPARLVLHDAHRRPDERRRRLVPAGAAAAHDRRRQDDPAGRRRRTTATTTTSGSTRSTRSGMIVGNDGGVDVSLDGGETLVRAAAADRAVLQRRRRRPRALPRRRHDAGRGHGVAARATALRAARRHRARRLARRSAAARRATSSTTRATRTSSTPASTAASSRTTTQRTGQARNVCVYPTNPSGHGAERAARTASSGRRRSPSRRTTRSVLYHGANVLFRTQRPRRRPGRRSAPT